MIIDTNTMISITEANQNFSKVTKVVDEHGTAVILKNNVPRYLVIDFSKAENFSNEEKAASNEDVFSISERLIKQNMEAYEVLKNENFEQGTDIKDSCEFDRSHWRKCRNS